MCLSFVDLLENEKGFVIFMAFVSGFGGDWTGNVNFMQVRFNVAWRKACRIM